METVYFQRDGATAHTALASMVVLRNIFLSWTDGETYVSWTADFAFGNIMWPPKSPDLYCCVLLLWGYLQRIYAQNPALS